MKTDKIFPEIEFKQIDKPTEGFYRFIYETNVRVENDGEYYLVYCKQEHAVSFTEIEGLVEPLLLMKKQFEHFQSFVKYCYEVLHLYKIDDHTDCHTAQVSTMSEKNRMEFLHILKEGRARKELGF